MIELHSPTKWATVIPLPCVVLGIDPARVSGWSIFARGKYVTSGVAKTQADRELAVRIANAESGGEDIPLVVVAERWNPGGKWYTATKVGIGTAWGLWLAELERIGLPKRRVVRVYPQTWRAAVLGMGGRGATTEACHQAALARANTLHHASATSSDEAEAIAIAEWGTRSGEVAAVLPKRKGKR